MKRFIFLCLIFTSLSVFGNVSILSDLDDTIKITQSSGKVTDYLYSDVFTGMPEFFKASQGHTNELHILSASPTLLREKIKHGLKKHHIDFHSLVLRKNIAEEKFIYKVREIKKIMESSSDDFILIGDDYGQDPEVYAEIKKQYPERIKDAYIHVIKGRVLPQSVTAYWTSFDLFLREYVKKRINPGWIDQAAQILLSEKNFRKIIPKKAQCPTESRIFEWQLLTVFQTEAFEVTKKITESCRAIRSSILIL